MFLFVLSTLGKSFGISRFGLAEIFDWTEVNLCGIMLTLGNLKTDLW